MTDTAIWASFLTLSALEIILGIDNVIFIALLVNHLPDTQRDKARKLGLGLALVLRIVMLFGVVHLIQMTKPVLTLLEHGFSAKDLVMLGGGLFLLAKATSSIHDEVTQDRKASMSEFQGSFFSTVMQILLVDFVFSADSLITAVGLTSHVGVILAAMIVGMGVMIAASAYVAGFIEKHPTLKMLALSFVMMIGMLLVAEGFGMHVPKGYVYFAMFFSLLVEGLNILARHRRTSKAS